MDFKKYVKSSVKLRLAYPDYKKKLFSLKQNSNIPRWLVIGTPIHDNLGDHLITLSELDYLNGLPKTKEIIEIPTEMFLLYNSIIREYISPLDIIFVNGGGWMGTLWPGDEYIMQNILYSFKKNLVIVFPQTVYYDPTDENFSTVLSKAKSTWEQAKNAILTVRDEASYQFAINYMGLPPSRCMLLPDVALLYKTTSSLHTSKEKKVLLCLRKDKERLLSANAAVDIERYLRQLDYRFEYTSTLSHKVIPVAKRRNLVNKKINEFSATSLVITDRLHGMIFSYLAQTPCIAIDNKSKKVLGVYNAWLSNCEFVYPAKQESISIKTAISLALNKEENYSTQAEKLLNYYQTLERIFL